MSVLQRTIRFFVLTSMAVAGQFSLSQNGYHPSATPVHVDPDWQLFAPVQLQDMEDIPARKRANTGFFLTYDRMLMMVTRPETEPGGNSLDEAWGNRYDFGWSKEKGGWNFSYIDLAGPNEYNRFRQRWLNYPLPAIATGGGGGTGIPPDAILQAPETLTQRYRTFEMLDSLNVGDLKSFEANKTWRLEPYRYGGILEPMIGMRYIGFEDVAIDDNYQVVTGVPTEFATNTTVETFTRQTARTDNNMLLGQIGFRYMKFVRRWTFSNDAKVFAGHVYQNQLNSRDVFTNYYGATVTQNQAALQELDRRGTTFSSRRNDESTVGFDIRVEAAYKAFKRVDLRAGFQMLYIGRGVWRGSTPANNDDQFAFNNHLIIPGFTAGLTWNR